MRTPLRRIVLTPLAGLICASVASAYPKSDHYDGQRFFNPGVNVDKGFFDLLKWQFGGGKQKWPTEVANVAHPKIVAGCGAGEAHVTFVNHATHLIQLKGMNVLTDPLFSERASPLSWIGPKRVRAPGVAIADLPKIDLIVVSHNHYDHLDLPSLKTLVERDHPVIVVPLGNRARIDAAVQTRVIEADWWEDVQITPEANVTVVPTQHWSARTPFDRNRALWSGFVIRAGGVKVYFAGDTGYGPHFAQIAARAGSPDVAILPIGAFEPRWFMKTQHMDPDDAVKAYLDLKPRLALATHYGTFQLTNEGIDEPRRRLIAGLKSANVEVTRFLVPDQGETVVFKK